MKARIITLILVSLSIVSCSLNQEPATSWTDSTYYKSEGQIKALVAGGYTRLQAALGTGFMLFGDVRSDLYMLNNQNATEIRDMLNNNITAYNKYSNWNSFFYAIQQANLVIKHAPEMLDGKIISNDVFASVMGQSYAIRAFSYFWIVRIWGDAPILTTPSVSDSYHAEEVRKPAEDVFTLILDDLKAAREYLSDNGDRTHFTKSAAWALEAQVLAWKKDWDGVLKACANVNASIYKLANLYSPDHSPSDPDFLNYIAGSGYANIFNVGEQPESIFELSYSIDDSSESKNLYKLVANSESLHPSIACLDEYKANRMKDWRYFVNFYDNKKITKYFINFGSAAAETRNVILLRYGEIVLLQAEAYAEKAAILGAEGGAAMLKNSVVALNDIRNRAGGPAYTLDPAAFTLDDIDELRNYIAEERKIELYGEGYRYFDLIRTGKVLERMEPINGQNDMRSVVWPIYYTEILYSNGKLVQNEYYR